MTLDLGIFSPWNVSEVMSLWEDESAASAVTFFSQDTKKVGKKDMNRFKPILLAWVHSR